MPQAPPRRGGAHGWRRPDRAHGGRPDIADRIEAARRALSLPSAGNAQLYGALRDGLRLAAAAPSASPALKREADALAERLDAALRLARTGR